MRSFARQTFRRSRDRGGRFARKAKLLAHGSRLFTLECPSYVTPASSNRLGGLRCACELVFPLILLTLALALVTGSVAPPPTVSATSAPSASGVGPGDHPRVPGHGAETYIAAATARSAGRTPPTRGTAGSCPAATSCWRVSKSKEYPGGGAVEVTRDGKVVFELQGHAVRGQHRAALRGRRRRPLPAHRGRRQARGCWKWTATGKVVVEVPLKAQTKDHHLQTRMARKLPERQLPRAAAARQGRPRVHAGGQGRLGGEDPDDPMLRSPRSAWTTATR